MLLCDETQLFCDLENAVLYSDGKHEINRQ